MVRGVHIGARRDQVQHHLQIAAGHRPQQCGFIVNEPGIHIGARVDQSPHRLQVAIRRRFHQRAATIGGVLHIGARRDQLPH